MRSIRAKSGPSFERPYFDLDEIDRMCSSELRAVGLYPSKPEPVRIDRFIEKRFVTHEYEQLPPGVLGFTVFGKGGVKRIVVSSDLEGAEGTPSERRLRTTLAHEAGHGLMHAYLFALGTKPASLFGDIDETPQILCRDVVGESRSTHAYDGRWWEFQANRAIGGLLIPRSLLERALNGFCERVGSFGRLAVPAAKMEQAVPEVARVFNVNPAVARIRIADVLPQPNNRQLSL
jgi:hypothetical protein